MVEIISSLVLEYIKIMTPNLFNVLFSNVYANFTNLRNDFLGFSINLDFFISFALNLLIALIIIGVYFILGNKIRKKVFRNNSLYVVYPLISISIGYIIVGSLTFALGFISALYLSVLYLFFFLILIFTFLPLSETKKDFKEIKLFIKSHVPVIKQNKFISFFVLLFVIIAFVKLLAPEIREDQYHTDLPITYLRAHTIMIPKGDLLKVIPSPQLAEMSYLITIVFNNKESSRYLNFFFYLLILSFFYLVSKGKEYKYVSFGALIFASSPVVIKETSTAYVEFQFILFFLLSVIILTKNKFDFKNIFLAGILFGATMATKLWTVTFLIVPLFYILIQERKVSKTLLIFIFSSLLVSLPWYIRSFIISGTPFFPAFSNSVSIENFALKTSIFDYIGLNYRALYLSNLKELSPLFFLGIFYFLTGFKKNFVDLLRNGLFTLAGIILFEYVFIQYYLGRYLLGGYPLVLSLAAKGLNDSMKNSFIKVTVFFTLSVMSVYYLTNTLLVLPYSLGWADENKYLTRILSRDGSSYYNYDHKFSKFLSKNDYVAYYGIINGFYYSDFPYKDIRFIFTKSNKDFLLLKKEGFTKLLVRGGDIAWFCNLLPVKNCDKNKYLLLSSYPKLSMYLYEIK